MTKPNLTLASSVVVVAMLTSQALAADLPVQETPVFEPIKNVSPWSVEVGAYGFIPVSVQGTSVVDGGAVDLDLDLSDVLGLLEFAVSGRGEAWRARDVNDGSAFGFVFDAQYVNLGLKEQSIGPAAGGTVKADIRQGIIDAMVGYRFASLSTGDNPNQRIDIDVTAGARYNYLRQKITVTPGLPAPFTANLGGDKHWVSPVVGARANFVLNDHWNFILRGDMSGFGVSGEDLS
jgi:hypothetical protein